MAIRMLIEKSDINRQVDGNPTYTELDDADRKYLDESTSTGKWKREMVFEITWTGCVLKLGEHNHYHDSDFFATVWDDAKGGPRDVEYASTRGWSYANNAAVDATDEVQAKYAAWQHERAVERQAARDAADAATPHEGKTVTVVKGRKIPKGTVAQVVWFGEDKYNSTRWLTKYRVGLMIDGARVFTSADNVEVAQA